MRIISGTHKGRRLKAPNNLPVRPTTDRAKEGIFNILQHQYNWNETEVLDLFAGIGGISLEFASRGVSLIHSVDQNRKCLLFIKQCKEKLNTENLQTTISKAEDFIIRHKKQYDIVFADPPYNYKDYENLINNIISNLLAQEGVFILEHSRNNNFENHSSCFRIAKYGESHFSFFRINNEDHCTTLAI